jgi:thiol-disulfide isomerase/thioredoxin
VSLLNLYLKYDSVHGQIQNQNNLRVLNRPHREISLCGFLFHLLSFQTDCTHIYRQVQHYTACLDNLLTLIFSPFCLGLLTTLFQFSFALYESGDDVFALTSANFDRSVLQSDQVWIVEFYAPWCGHCKNLAPEYKKAATALKVNFEDKKNVSY